MQCRKYNAGCIPGIAVNPDRCFLKVLVFAGINIYKLLRVTVKQQEPAALLLHRDPVPLFKSMGNIMHGITDAGKAKQKHPDPKFRKHSLIP
jgi:hypothetical protein